MKKTILLTGATDGIGLVVARKLVELGHHVLLHGRNPDKLAAVCTELDSMSADGSVESHVADLSHLAEVSSLADAIAKKHQQLDVLINNAGIFRTANPLTDDGQDVRFVVNTLAPYLLTRKLLPLMKESGRIVNLSSAAQAPVNLDALAGKTQLQDEYQAYAQSKLAITMWSRLLGQQLEGNGPLVVAVNPGSLLATKMVKEGFGMAGNDINIGADILIRAALSEEFNTATGLYYDNDNGTFADPHQDALDTNKCDQVVQAVDTLVAGLL